MHSFRVDGAEPEAFVEKVREALERRGFDDLVAVRLEGSELTVRFHRLGTTTLRFGVRRQAGGFRADYLGARVAALHAPFASAFEERFEDLLAGVGARLASD